MNPVSSLLDKELRNFFGRVITASLCRPHLVPTAIQIFIHQVTASFRRNRTSANAGVPIPPFIIMSVTSTCNLACAGCYAQHLHAHIDDKSKKNELTDESLKRILTQADAIGISNVIIAGGEPLIRSNLLEIISGFKRMVFPVFTNGMMVSDTTISILKKAKNVILVISIEGDQAHTDERRGEGVYGKTIGTMHTLRSANIFFGVSITVSTKNFDIVCAEEFITGLIAHGCGIFFFVEYVPVQAATEHIALSAVQRSELLDKINKMRYTYSTALFVAFPGDEAKFGGCLASGRGFVHINAVAEIEPCPFAPYSDTNLNGISLIDGLASSQLLKAIRQNHGMLNESVGGCALWQNREWVAAQISKNVIKN